MAESIMLDKAKDFAVEIVYLCKNIKETKKRFRCKALKRKTKYDIIALVLKSKVEQIRLVEMLNGWEKSKNNKV